MINPIEQFKEALAIRGIQPPSEILADGVLHRCEIAGSKGKEDGAYVLHINGIAAGGFQNWKDGKGWQNWRAVYDRPLSRKELVKYRSILRSACKARELEQSERRKRSGDKAKVIWESATSCESHPYLKNKNISHHGARQYRDLLVLPLTDTTGDLQSLQFIRGDGAKRFLKDGKIRGCYLAIGTITETICVAEGFATAATIHEATGYYVFIAFNCGNLLSVAKDVRGKHPNAKLILCADDDWQNPDNPGLTKSKEAALAVDGFLAVPKFGPNRKPEEKDFNDLGRTDGLDTIRLCIERAEQFQNYKNEGNKKQVISHNFNGGRFELTDRGTFFIGFDGEGSEKPPQWLCSPLKIVAKTRDEKSGAWGRLIEWNDDDGVYHRWAMPLELLQGDGTDFRRELASLGLGISHSKPARDLLAVYLQFWPVEERAKCVERLGWHENIYVSPDRAIGASNEKVVFQNCQAIDPAHSNAGTLEEWRDSIGRVVAGNSRLVFSISVAFAGPLLNLIGEDSGGFHLRGSSSSGKSTALKLAASVWGNPSAYVRLWRATVNGLEGLATLHNDSVLILDELSQLAPGDAGSAAYLLANGKGKARASKNGTARASQSWRVLVLSAGEESLASLLSSVGKRTNAGQDIRLADIPADAGVNMGIFEELHGSDTPADFALKLKNNASKFYGTVGQAWLENIVSNYHQIEKFLSDNIIKFCTEVVPVGSTGQIERVARRIALAAITGELASHYGITGWREGESIDAGKKCFEVWLEGFGGSGNREERSLLSQIKVFFEAHEKSRFEPLDATDEQRIINRVGYIDNLGEGTRRFYVLPESFKKELCSGFDSTWAAKVLIAHGWIEPGPDRSTQKPRIMKKPTRVYVFTQKIWEDE